MIQFNLLPSVKLEYVKARRIKRLTMLISSIVTIAGLVVIISLFLWVQVQQKNHSKDLSADIKTESSKLEGIEDLNKILTIQNQLGSLSALHDQKPVTTRLLGFIKQVTPANVSIATLNVDFSLQTMEIIGSADAISTINTFADTLKFTGYIAGDSKGPAFTDVVLTSFGKDDKGSSYTLTLKYDPNIFASASEVTLDIPADKKTTRSQTEKPLFEPLSKPASGGQ